MRVLYLEQIIRGLLLRFKTEQYTKKALCTYVNRLRWCFWHANAVKAEHRMRQILLLCRIVVAQTARFARSLVQLDYRLGELLATSRAIAANDCLRETLSRAQADFDGDGGVSGEPGDQCTHGRRVSYEVSSGLNCRAWL